MRHDLRNLDIVVATAPGGRKESKRPGYYSTTICTHKLTKVRTANPGNSLGVKVPGLNISPPFHSGDLFVPKYLHPFLPLLPVE
ncbi:MAG: hypothetical protein ABJB86_07170 [Bacteroidota bacterium]